MQSRRVFVPTNTVFVGELQPIFRHARHFRAGPFDRRVRFLFGFGDNSGHAFGHVVVSHDRLDGQIALVDHGRAIHDAPFRIVNYSIQFVRGEYFGQT